MPPARFLYTAALYAALPFILIYLAKKRRLNRESFGYAPPSPPNAPLVVWLHSVSVGESAAADDIIRFLRRQNCRLLLTHTTESGGRRLRDLHGDYAEVCHLPLDLPSATKRFVNRVRPHLAIFMEGEYWPNCFAAMREAGVFLLIANARLGKRAARRRAHFAPLMREMAQTISAAATQTRADARRLAFFGTRPIAVAGNLKFDRTPDAAKIRTGEEWKRSLRTDKTIVVVAGSRPGEETLLLQAADDDFFRQHFVIFALRHPERGDEVEKLIQKRGIPYNRRTKEKILDGEKTNIHIADTLGEMDSFYVCCDVALIGGSFRPFGGQNPIEAMAVGAPAVIGPHTDNYAALVAEATKCGALRQAKNAEDALRQVCALARNESQRKSQIRAGRDLCAVRRGALRAHTEIIASFLHNPPAIGV